MCGRYARYRELEEWLGFLKANLAPSLLDVLAAQDTGPRYNIAPGTNGWIAAFDPDGELGVVEKKWAFPTSRGNRINVRSETAHVVPEYREHFNQHRCVVFADGFYEPRGEKGGNRPWFFFHDKEEAPLFMGAIAKAEGFSILTQAPVEPVASIHDRMPVLVPAENVLAWLDPGTSGREALERFAPAKYGTQLECWPVSGAAKRPGNEGKELIEPMRGH